MCGIIYVKRKDGKPAYKSVLKRYRKQKDRGSEGFGYLAIEGNEIVSYKRAQFEHEIIKLIETETASEILFHHRYPTSTPNIEESAHPLMVLNQAELASQYYIVHNGVIQNDDDLKKEHEEKGFKYRTQISRSFKTFTGREYFGDAQWNDSEAIAIETALCLDGKQHVIGARGSAAVVAIKAQGTQVEGRYFFRNDSNPLNYYDNDMLTVLSSEGSGEAVKTTYVYCLNEDGSYDTEPRNLFTPYSRHQTYGSSYYGQGGGSEYEDEWGKKFGEAMGGDAEGHTQTLLPSAHEPRTGFLADREGEEAELDFSGIVQPIEAMQIGEIIKGMSPEFVAMMTDDVLWAEFDRVIGAREQIESGMETFTRKVEEMGAFDADVLASQVQLENTLDRVKEYERMLEDEITSREGAGGMKEAGVRTVAVVHS